MSCIHASVGKNMVKMMVFYRLVCPKFLHLYMKQYPEEIFLNMVVIKFHFLCFVSFVVRLHLKFFVVP